MILNFIICEIRVVGRVWKICWNVFVEISFLLVKCSILKNRMLEISLCRIESLNLISRMLLIRW